MSDVLTYASINALNFFFGGLVDVVDIIEQFATVRLYLLILGHVLIRIGLEWAYSTILHELSRLWFTWNTGLSPVLLVSSVDLMILALFQFLSKVTPDD